MENESRPLFFSSTSWVRAMRVEFDASLDDMVDAAFRALSPSRSFSPYRWTDNLGGAIFSGLVAGTACYWVIPGSQEVRIVVAGFAGVASAALFPILRIWEIKQRLRRYYREILGSYLPFSVEVELTPEGVCTKQKTGQTTYAWQQVESIRETADSIDVYARHGGLVVVRKRAFESAGQMQQFVEKAGSYLMHARQLENL